MTRTGLIRPPCADLESRRRRDAPARFPSQGCPGRGPRSFPSAEASATGQGPAIPSSAGQVGVGAEAIRPAPPASRPAGAVEASRTRRTGATRPKTGGSMVCGGIHVGVRGWKAPYGPLTEGCSASAGASRRGIGRDWRSGAILGPSRSSPAPGPAVNRKRRSGRRPLRRSTIEACLDPLAHRPPSISPAPPGGPYPGPCL